jgi:hypothetical protein
MAKASLIKDRTQIQQIRSYDGMRWGRISPTDIDGFVEFDDKIFIFFEVKYSDARMPRGQELAFERLVDAIAPPRKAILIIGKHETELGNDVEFHKCKVTKFRTNGTWFKVQNERLLREVADSFIEYARAKLAEEEASNKLHK